MSWNRAFRFLNGRRGVIARSRVEKGKDSAAKPSGLLFVVGMLVNLYNASVVIVGPSSKWWSGMPTHRTTDSNPKL